MKAGQTQTLGVGQGSSCPVQVQPRSLSHLGLGAQHFLFLITGTISWIRQPKEAREGSGPMLTFKDWLTGSGYSEK